MADSALLDESFPTRKIFRRFSEGKTIESQLLFPDCSFFQLQSEL